MKVITLVTFSILFILSINPLFQSKEIIAGELNNNIPHSGVKNALQKQALKDTPSNIKSLPIVAYHQIYSGKEPDAEIFLHLKQLGVKTIISVDGMKPDVDKARQIGARYIHLPIGYGPLSSQRRQQLIYAFQTCEQPLYLHCHHGIHRGPAAIAVALKGTGKFTQQEANKLLNKVGTSKDYPGLWQAVKNTRALKNIPEQELPEISSVDNLTSMMAAADRIYDRLKLFKKNKWQTLPQSPDTSARRESLLLLELFKEWNRTAPSDKKMQLTFSQAEQNLTKLHQVLGQEEHNSQKINAAFDAVRQDCRSCHRKFRD